MVKKAATSRTTRNATASKVTPTGSELPPKSSGKQLVSEMGGAGGGAIATAQAQLERLAELWPKLAETTRRRLLDAVEAEAAEGGG
jgi:hypothetical protein